MAKARAIVKRRKAVRNIRKITKTMQMIATAKFQKSLKRAVGTKPYTHEGARAGARAGRAASGNVEHPLLRRPGDEDRNQPHRAAGASPATAGWPGRTTAACCAPPTHFIRQQEAAGKDGRPLRRRQEGHQLLQLPEAPDHAAGRSARTRPRFADVERLANEFIDGFIAGEIDAVHVAYMNFISAGVQKPEVMTLLPLAGVETPAAARRDGASRSRRPAHASSRACTPRRIYDFSPEPQELLDELLPLTVKTALFQTFLDATTSEHVARMVAMKSATDNADKMQQGADHAIQPRPPEPDHDRAVGNHGRRRGDERVNSNEGGRMK